MISAILNYVKNTKTYTEEEVIEMCRAILGELITRMEELKEENEELKKLVEKLIEIIKEKKNEIIKSIETNIIGGEKGGNWKFDFKKLFSGSFIASLFRDSVLKRDFF